MDKIHMYLFYTFLGLSIGGLSIIYSRDVMHEEACRPYEPTERCALAKYEITVHDLTDRGQVIGVAEGSCVTKICTGKSKRYAMPEATFTAMNRTDIFENGIEVPAAQSHVCRVE